MRPFCYQLNIYTYRKMVLILCIMCYFDFACWNHITSIVTLYLFFFFNSFALFWFFLIAGIDSHESLCNEQKLPLQSIKMGYDSSCWYSNYKWKCRGSAWLMGDFVIAYGTIKSCVYAQFCSALLMFWIFFTLDTQSLIDVLSETVSNNSNGQNIE